MAKKYKGFDDMFIGQNVSMMLNQTVSDQSEGVTATMPIMIEGVMVGSDEFYFYVGEDPNSVSVAIKRDQVIMVTIVEEKEEKISLAKRSKMN